MYWRCDKKTMMRGLVTAVASAALLCACSAAPPCAPVSSAAAAAGTEPPPDQCTGQTCTGVTREGYHWIGAVRPKLVIEEFGDYECFFCQRAHHNFKALLEAHPGSVRLIYRHFPLGRDCNPGLSQDFHARACAQAKLAECAGEQGRFWDVHDYLMERVPRGAPDAAEAVAKDLGLDAAALAACLKAGATGRVTRDVEDAQRLGIKGTPTYVLGDELHPGDLPRGILRECGVHSSE